MDNMSLMCYLSKLLPNIDLMSNKSRDILNSAISQEEKLVKILLNYFNKQKTNYDDGNTLETEARYINKLFPTLTQNYILELLDVFKDMPYRVEIVLRTIVKCKMYDKHKSTSQAIGVKRGNAVQVEPLVNNVNNYCHPIKIRKVSDGSNTTYTVIGKKKLTSIANKSKVPIVTPLQNNNNYSNNILLSPVLVGNTLTVDLQKASVSRPPTARNCTVTSVTAIPKVQENKCSGESVSVIYENSRPMKYTNKLLAINHNPTYLAFPREITNIVTVPPNNDQYSGLVFPSATNSCVVSSSDEISNIIGLKENDVSTSDQNPKNGQCAIQKNVNSSYDPQNNIEQNVFNLDTPILDENAVHFATQHCTVNSSNETLDTKNNETVCLDFFSELPIPANLSDLPSHANEILQPAAEAEFKIETVTNNITSHTSEEPLEKSTDSQKTIELSPLIFEHLNDENVAFHQVIENQDVFDNNSKQDNGQYINNIPSTSKQPPQNEMTEAFDLIQYLKEITNAPENVIRIECNRLNLPTWVKPSLPLCEVIIDKLLTNSVSIDSSNSEDDSNGVIFESELMNTSPSPINLDSIDSNLNVGLVITANTEQKNDVQNSERKILKTTSLDSSITINTQLVNYLCGIFPDACPDYIRGLCKGKPMSNEVVDELTTIILNSNDQYPKRTVVLQEPEIVPENQLEILKEFLPDADPDYLRMMCDRFNGKPELVKSFLNEAMERRNYPTMKDYQRRQQLSAQQRQYTTEFTVENFIKVIPDPHKFFSDTSRVVNMDALSCHYALVFLRNAFPKLTVRVIQAVFNKYNSNLYRTYQELQQVLRQNNLWMKSTRKAIEMPKSIQNIPLLQEIAYYTHQKEINEHLQRIKEKEEIEHKDALSKGLMKTCSCCYDEEVLPRNIYVCENGCSFCKFCIVKSTEVRFGEGKLDFPCLSNCSSQFSIQTLQAVLSPKIFSRIAQKKALEEVKAAGIEELEMCPFCDFATIPAAGYSVFSCLNPDCMKESCRLCKEPSHIPLRCDEIEKDEDVKARTFVENKMTEALLKKCWKCGIKFFKEEGCNKMTCSCGASMCYVCGKPVTDYKHFNGNGGDRFDLCPLYSDTNVLNKENVLKAGEQAKAEIGNRTLKHDPTKDVHEHYKARPKFPQQILVQQPRDAEFLLRMRDIWQRYGVDRRNRRHPF